MRQVTAVKFIPEWTPYQFKMMERAIAANFRGTTLRTKHGDYYFPNVGTTFKRVDNVLGLAYTSTGIWACYGVCNTEPYFDMDNLYQYSYFVIGEDGKYYAILEDKDENQLVIEI